MVNKDAVNVNIGGLVACFDASHKKNVKSWAVSLQIWMDSNIERRFENPFPQECHSNCESRQVPIRLPKAEERMRVQMIKLSRYTRSPAHP